MSQAHWQYEPAADLEQSISERLSGFPRQPDMLVYGLRTCGAAIVRAGLRVYHRFEVTGRQNLPTQGSYVLICNHASHLDALCLQSCLPFAKLHRAFPAAAQDYFFVSLPRAVFAAIFINALPFARKVQMRQSLALCRKLLDNPGNILILFPEGSRSTTGDLSEFKPGIGLLTAGLNVPVVPCALQGAYRAFPKGKFIPRPAKLRLIIGQPRTYAHLAPGAESARIIAAELHTTVKEMLCS